MDKSNRIMQSSVAYQLQEQAGAYAQERLSISYDIDSDKTTAFTYGDWAVLGTHKGADDISSGSAVGNLIGVVKYESSGIIDETGYLGGSSGFYTNVPILKQGLVYVPASGTVDLDSTLYLMVDATKAGYGTVRNGSATGAIDISSIASVIKKSANSLVLIDLNIK